MPQPQVERLLQCVALNLGAEANNCPAPLGRIPIGPRTRWGQNAGMSLKLFRSTGYSSILMAGETRLPMHPGWMIFATSIWVGFACNVVLWRQLRAPGSSSLGQALATGAFAAAACAIILSVLGWRKTLKPAATLILFLAALAVCAAWERPAGETGLLMMPSLSGLLQWQAWATLAGLALLPAIWVGKTRLRRLPGNQQLSANMACIFAAATVLAASGFALFGSQL
jgi:glucan phosphoethanolaminetransferase (alkaline phosphatase superfamily)